MYRKNQGVLVLQSQLLSIFPIGRRCLLSILLSCALTLNENLNSLKGTSPITILTGLSVTLIFFRSETFCCNCCLICSNLTSMNLPTFQWSYFIQSTARLESVKRFDSVPHSSISLLLWTNGSLIFFVIGEMFEATADNE